MYPEVHVQIGLWLIVWQLALWPHIPGHGSLHFCPIHALSRLHSVLITHSGRQLGGLPINSGRHEHIAWPLSSLHWLLGPQGDGLHGLVGSTGVSKIKNNYHLKTMTDLYLLRR